MQYTLAHSAVGIELDDGNLSNSRPDVRTLGSLAGAPFVHEDNQSPLSPGSLFRAVQVRGAAAHGILVTIVCAFVRRAMSAPERLIVHNPVSAFVNDAGFSEVRQTLSREGPLGAANGSYAGRI
jgi:hypothetical protein